MRLLVSKSFFYLFLLSCTFFYFCPPAHAADTGWVINEFTSDITIHQDTTVSVLETIEVDFKNLQKHGIYRTIPVKYQTQYGNNFDIRFKLLSVTDKNKQSYQVKQTKEGNDIKLRIGDPDKTVSGQQTYRLAYRVERVITRANEQAPPQTSYVGGQAELYWNATGHNWPVPILSSKVQMTAPGKILNTICFKGYFGSAQGQCQHTSGRQTAHFSTGLISPRQGLTVSVLLDPQALSFPSFGQQVLMFLSDNWLYGTPLVTLSVMVWLYWRRGRDKQFKNLFHESEDVETVPWFQKLDALSVYGPPKDLSPGEVGVLVDEKVHLRDITAVAIDLARRDFFKIKEIKKKGLFSKTDFELIHNDKDETKLHQFEKSVLDMLFGKKRKDKVKLNKLPKSAYKHLATTQKELYQHLTKEGYFSGNPKTVRKLYLGVGIGVAFVGIALSFIGAVVSSIGGWAFASITSGLIIIIFSLFMPARTAKGRKVLKEVVGLREWVKLGAWREKIHEKLNFFEEVLPYVIAFGLTKKFIEAFKSADLKNLDWYQSSGTFNVVRFSNAMNSFGGSISSGVAATRPKSASRGGSGFSGGGSSGGGFGGGGGGSW